MVSKSVLNIPDTEGAAALLPNWIYATATLCLYLFNVVGAIFVSDVEVVVGFIGSISCSFLNCVLPAMYYIMTARRKPELQRNKTVLVLAYLLAIYGCIMAVMCTGMRIVELAVGE